MLVIILPIVFLTIWTVFARKNKDIIEGLVFAEILFHTILLAITNIWSVGGLLNRWSIYISWMVVLAVIVWFGGVNGYLFDREKKFQLKVSIGNVRANLTWIEKGMFLILAVLFLVLFVGAIFTVPYNYDSMTYHLGRIGHWIDQGSVNYFVTSIDRQLYSPVLSEYEMLHIFLLTGSDSFLNFLQYFAMIFTGVILYQTARKLNTSRVFSIMAAFLYYTMPLTISQSITTQNDLLASMWFAIFLYYFVDFINAEEIHFDRTQKKKLVLIGASVAFAFLTKSSICASMIFFMPWLLVVCIGRKDKFIQLVKSAVLAGATLVVLISETLIRTYISCGSLMADTTSANIMVATKNVKYILVNICKNFSLLITQHLFRPLNGVIYRFAIRVGSILQVDFNNEAISYHGFDFLHHMNMGDDMYSHDKTPSAVVAYLALLAGIVLVVAIVCVIISRLVKKEKKSENTSWYQRMSIGFGISAWLSLGFIMALLRWQPWGTRLMYPALAMMVIMIANVLSALVGGRGEYSKGGAVVLVCVCLLSTVFCVRPIIYNMKPAAEFIQSGCDNRMSRYFRFNDRYTAYQQLIRETEIFSCKDIGVSISGDGYDYPLWLMYRKANKDVYLHHVLLDGEDLKGDDKQTEIPDCILYIERGALSVGDMVKYHGVDYECIYVSDVNPDAPDSILIRMP